MSDTIDKKNEFIGACTENLMEKFVICFNSVTKQYKSSDLLITEEVAPALLHTASYAAFNFLTYLACHYAEKGQEETFFEDFQEQFAAHCGLVSAQLLAHTEEDNQIIITDETIIND